MSVLHLLRSDAVPESAAAGVQEFKILRRRDDGQFEARVVAQFFDHPNDQFMVFQRGAFRKTLEGVGSGRVKVNYHHLYGSVDAAVGTVVAGEEARVGLVADLLISSKSGELATKMEEGHVDEMSIEFHPVREGTISVPLAEMDDAARWYVEQSGSAYAPPVLDGGVVPHRLILEAAWVGLAITPRSSQGKRALIPVGSGVPSVDTDMRLGSIPFADLPIANPGVEWDPEQAAARVQEWAGIVCQPGNTSCNSARLALAHLCRGWSPTGEPLMSALIADVVDGALVVVPQALKAARESLPPHAPGKVLETLSRYEAKAKGSAAGAAPCACGGAVVESEKSSAEDAAGPPEAPTGKTVESNRDAIGVEIGLLGLRASLLGLEIGALGDSPHEPTGTGRGPASEGRTSI